MSTETMNSSEMQQVKFELGDYPEFYSHLAIQARRASRIALVACGVALGLSRHVSWCTVRFRSNSSNDRVSAGSPDICSSSPECGRSGIDRGPRLSRSPPGIHQCGGAVTSGSSRWRRDHRFTNQRSTSPTAPRVCDTLASVPLGHDNECCAPYGPPLVGNALRCLGD